MLTTRSLRAIGAHLRLHAEWYLVPLFFLVVVACRYQELWYGQAGFGWDVIESYWPDLTFLANEFHRWNFPLWNPFERGGYPAHADPQPALFSPIQWLFALWVAWIRRDAWYAMQIKELLHHALGGIVLYLYLRTRKLVWPAALFAGFVLVLSSPWYVNSANNYLYAMPWAPLVWLATDRLFEKPTRVRGCALAAALYLPASAGSPPGYFYVLLTAILYGAFRAVPWIVRRVVVWRSRKSVDDPAARQLARHELGSLAAALVVAAGLVAATQLVIFLPAHTLLTFSWREGVPANFPFIQSCPVVPTLTSIITPYGKGYGANLSLIAAVLAVFAVFAAPRIDRGAPLFFVASAAFFLLLSFGPKTPVLVWLVGHLPGFGVFRVACRYAVPYATVLACASAHGLSIVLTSQTRPSSKRLLAPIMATLVIVGLIGWMVQSGARPVDLDVWLFPALSLAALWALLLVRGRLAIALSIGLLGLVCFDAMRFYSVEKPFQKRPDDLEDRAKIAQLSDLDQYRIFDDFLLEQRSGSRLSLREFRGYIIGDPLAIQDQGTIVIAAVRSPQILAEYNVRYIFYGAHSNKGWSRKTLSAAPDVLAPARFRRLGPSIYEALHPAPMVAWYGALRVLPKAQVVPNLLLARDASGARRFAFVAAEDVTGSSLEAPAYALSRPGGPPTPVAISGQVTHFQTESVELEIDAPAAGVVVLNEVFYPGWKVFVDGRAASPLTVDLILRGVLVEAGHHRIRWIYAPPRWTTLIGLWWSGLLTMLVVGLWSRRRQIRGDGATARP